MINKYQKRFNFSSPIHTIIKTLMFNGYEVQYKDRGEGGLYLLGCHFQFNPTGEKLTSKAELVNFANYLNQV